MTTYGPDLVARGLVLNTYDEAFAKKIIAGTVTAADFVRALTGAGFKGEYGLDGQHGMGVWWGVMGEYGDLEDFEVHAETSGDPDLTLKGMQADGYTGADFIEGEISVVLIAKRPMRNGNEPWDPEVHNEGNGLMGNSYLDPGEQVELVEIRYDAGWGWKSLPARGLRAQASYFLHDVNEPLIDTKDMTGFEDKASFDWIHPQIATGGALRRVSDVRILARRGVTGIVSARRDFDDTLLTHDIDVLMLPMPDDGSARPTSWFKSAIDFCLPKLRRGEKVYIHCHAGMNRGPSLAYAVLRAYTGWDHHHAMQAIQSARSVALVGYAADADKALVELGYAAKTADVDTGVFHTLTGAKTAADDWLPDKGMWTRGQAGLDPRIFVGTQMKAEVRETVLGLLDGFWTPRYGDWRKWAKVYLAGSGASHWWDSDGDLDILIGIDMHSLIQARPQNAGVSEVDVCGHLDRELKADLDPTTAMYDFGPPKPMEVTFFVNPGSYDIARIHPYAAYDITDDGWVIEPPVLPEDWSADSMPPWMIEHCREIADGARRVLALPEPQRTIQGVALFNRLHEWRQEAYAEGNGWLSFGNVVYQWLSQEGLLRQLYLLKHPEQKTASQDWKIDPVPVDDKSVQTGGKIKVLYALDGQGQDCGYIAWSPVFKTVDIIAVREDMRRKGIGTALWQAAIEIEPDLKHSEDVSPDGKAWMKSLGARMVAGNFTVEPAVIDGQPCFIVREHGYIVAQVNTIEEVADLVPLHLLKAAARADNIYGRNDIDALFPDGALLTMCPWPQAYRTKTGMYDKEAVRKALSDPNRDSHMAEFDPRQLKAIQPSLTRQGVAYYLSDQYRHTGETFADKGNPGNKTPVVYIRGGEQILLAGHHRAAAALLKGETLHALRIEAPSVTASNSVGHPVAVRRRASEPVQDREGLHGEGSRERDPGGRDRSAPARSAAGGREGARGLRGGRADADGSDRLSAVVAGENGERPKGIVYERNQGDGERSIDAWYNGVFIGTLAWFAEGDRYGEIMSIEVDPAYQRRGIATEMLRRARKWDPKVHHSDDLTDDGRAWSQRVAGPAGGRIPAGVKARPPFGSDIYKPRPVRIGRKAGEDIADLEPDERDQVLAAIKRLERGKDQTVEAKRRPPLIGCFSLDVTAEMRVLFFLHTGGWWEIFGVTPDHNYDEIERRMRQVAGLSGDLPEGLIFVLFENPDSRVLVARTATGDPVGHLEWRSPHPANPKAYGRPGEILDVQVRRPYRRRGVASELLRRAREVDSNVHHSDALSDSGRAWSEKAAGLNGDLPEGMVLREVEFPSQVPHQVVRGVGAVIDGREVGSLYWRPHAEPGLQEAGEIASVHVERDYRRRGIATELLRRAREIDPRVHHSRSLSPDARAWSQRAAALTTHTYDGKQGRRDHITCDQKGTIATALIADMLGASGETPGSHRNMRGQQWEDFKADIAANGIKDPIFITVDWDTGAKISEGNHRRDAAVELGLEEVPVQIRYFGQAEKIHRIAGLHGDLPAGITFEIVYEDEEKVEIAADIGDPEFIANLEWLKDTHEIEWIGVSEPWRRRGVASAMLAFARTIDPLVHHSNHLSEDGAAWKQKVASKYTVFVGWGARTPGGPAGLTPDSHGRIVVVEAETDTEAIMLAAQMVNGGEGTNPIVALLPPGMVTSTEILSMEAVTNRHELVTQG